MSTSRKVVGFGQWLFFEAYTNISDFLELPNCVDHGN